MALDTRRGPKRVRAETGPTRIKRARRTVMCSGEAMIRRLSAATENLVVQEVTG